MSDNLFYVTDDEFEEKVLRSDMPVLVDFYADWCGPCKTIAPYLEELAKQFEGKVKIAKMNVDQNQRYAGQYGIRSIPTMTLFSGGKPVETIIGADPTRLREMVDRAA